MKIKIITILTCMFVLFLTWTFDNSLVLRPNLIEFKQLEPYDFKGMPSAFSKFDAGIHSGIEYSYDTINNRYRAFAFMDRNKSWMKSYARDSEELLRHEQYHFNLTKYFADKLDRLIVDEHLVYESNVVFELEYLVTELFHMQDEYDSETNHSLNVSIQNQWEYRIDSMLASFDVNGGIVNDPYSGAQVFLPEAKLWSNYDSINEISERIYYSEDYGMQRILKSTYDPDFNGFDKEGTFHSFQDKSNFVLDTIVLSDMEGLNKIVVKFKDTTLGLNYIHQDMYSDGFMYSLIVAFDLNENNQKGYESIANSFLESFIINQNDQYWIDQFERNKNSAYVFTMDVYGDKESLSADNCYIDSEFGEIGFKGFSVDLEDNMSIIPYHVPTSSNTRINSFILGYGRTIYVNKTDSTGVLFHLPTSALKNDLIFGYTLKNDSLEQCTPMYLNEFY